MRWWGPYFTLALAAEALRRNFASPKCAAAVVDADESALNAPNLLNPSKDAYLNDECEHSNRFVVVQLCQDILVDTVVVANYEFFSSVFRTIRILASDHYPVTEPSAWKVLGEFEAQDVRMDQAFEIASPQVWARFLRVDVLSHYGSEVHCPLSTLRVHGTTMTEQYMAVQKMEDLGACEAPPSASQLGMDDPLEPPQCTNNATVANETTTKPHIKGVQESLLEAVARNVMMRVVEAEIAHLNTDISDLHMALTSLQHELHTTKMILSSILYVLVLLITILVLIRHIPRLRFQL